MICQGTGGEALISQANLDRGMVDIFNRSVHEVRYGGVRVLPVMFQDDIILCTSILCSLKSNVFFNFKLHI